MLHLVQNHYLHYQAKKLLLQRKNNIPRRILQKREQSLLLMIVMAQRKKALRCQRPNKADLQVQRSLWVIYLEMTIQMKRKILD